MKKRLSLLMVVMMLVSMLPMSAFAASTAYPGTVPNVDEETTFPMSVSFKLNDYTNLTSGKTVQFELQNGEFIAAPTVKVDGTTVTSSWNSGAPKLTFFGTGAGKAFTPPSGNVVVNISGTVEVAGVGEVKLVVTDDNSGIGSQTVVVANGVSSSKADLAISVTDAEKAVSFDGGKLSQFTVKNFDKVASTDTIEVSLDDADLKLENTTTVLVDGGPAAFTRTTDGRIQLTGITSATKSIIVIPDVSVGRKAAEGNVTVTVSALKGSPLKSYMAERATIGKIVDYAVTMTVVQEGKKEIPALWGGEEATVTVTLKGPKGSILGRDIDFTVEGADVKYSTAATTKPAAGSALAGTNDDGFFEDGEFYVTNTATGLEEVKFNVSIKTDADKDGVATITAAQRGWEAKADLAKVTPKFAVETKVTPVKKGEAKDTSDLVIKEAKAGLIAKGEKIQLKFDTRRDYTQFTTKSIKVEGTNGMKFGDVVWTASTSVDKYTVLEIPVTKQSIGEAGVITISGLKTLVDGSATDDIVKLAVQLENATVQKVDYIKVVKEYDMESILSVFTIGQAAYTVNGIEKAAHTAPYIKEGRTMLPIRAVAESLGLTVQWNSATRTASFTDANKVAAVTIGAKVMYVNGTPMPLTVPAELTNDTTFVELRSLATAFGVQIDWDAAAKTATVSK